MDLERCSVSTSSSSSSSSSGSSSSGVAADQMMRIEMEAAEALADLAHLTMRECRSGDSGGRWGSKGKRGKKRIKSESSPDDCASNPVVDSVHSCPDLAPVSLLNSLLFLPPFFTFFWRKKILLNK